MTKRLEGKIALITGTGGGQGRAAALLFAKEGAIIVGCDIREEDDIETMKQVCEAGGFMIRKTVDLGNEDEARAWIDFAVKEVGEFDILYNNASACHYGKITEMPTESWRFNIRNEMDNVYFATKYAVPVMIRKGGGSIINTASGAALTGVAMGAVYQFAHAATKGAIIAMSRSLAVELGEHNIRVNSICPGVIKTPVLERMDQAMVNAMLDGIMKMQPIKRHGRAEDIAYCALYLASDESGWVTGQNFAVDGGLTAGAP